MLILIKGFLPLFNKEKSIIVDMVGIFLKRYLLNIFQQVLKTGEFVCCGFFVTWRAAFFNFYFDLIRFKRMKWLVREWLVVAAIMQLMIEACFLANLQH